MSVLELAFLGQVQFRWRDEFIRLSSAKAQALLAYLAVQRSPQSREHIQALFWPDSLPQAAQKNLRNVLWSIRRRLGEEVVRSQHNRLSLGAMVWTDVHVVEDAARDIASQAIDEVEAAVSLFRGALLEGVVVADAPEFELWLIAERERLARINMQLSQALLASYRASDNWPAVIRVAQRMMAIDALHEPTHVALMEAYSRLGDRRQVARQYETLERLLASELGLKPLSETTTHYHRFMEAPAAVTSESVSAAMKPPVRKEAERLSPFVGRERELAALDEVWRIVRGGESSVAALVGKMGIGKTRLWQEWAAGLPADVALFQTYCLDATQSDPFAPVIAMLRQSPLARAALHPPSSLGATWLAELSRLLPELPQHWPSLPLPLTLQSADERMRVFEALSQVILASDVPARVLFVDDLHWVDSATLDWLVYLVDRLRQSPFLLVLSYRSEEAPAQVAYALAGWQRRRLLQSIRLKNFTLADAAELLAALGADPERAADLQALSGGNPYFLLELSRVPPGETPPGLADLIRAHLDALSPGVRPILHAAAILKNDFDFETLQATGGQTTSEALDALDILLDQGVLSERDDRYDFDNPLAAAMVEESLSIARRRHLHRRAAQALEQTQTQRLAPAAARIAWHYAEAGDPVRGAAFADMAGERALAVAAPREAVTHYRQALLWEPRFDRQVSLGQALLQAGDTLAGDEVLREVVISLERASDIDAVALARARLALAGNYMMKGQRQHVASWAQKVLEQNLEDLPVSIVAQAHLTMAMGILGASRRLDDAEFHLRQAQRIAREHELSALVIQSQFERGNLMALRGDLEGATAAYADIISYARTVNEPIQEMLAYNNLAYHELLMGRLDEAQRHVEQGLKLADAYSFDPFYAYLYSTQGEIALAGGRFETAEASFTDAMTAATRWGNSERRAGIRANQGLLARARGDLDEALLCLQEASDLIAGESEPFLQTKINLWLVEIHERRGERAAALEALARAEHRLRESEYEGLQAWARRLRMGMDSG